MALKIQLRRGTASEWTSANPVLMQGEMGVETDTLKVKIGNGSTAWTSLPYFTQGVKGDTGATGATGPQGAKGDKGDIGDTGPANELSVGTVTTGAPGSAATVTISGDAPSQTISFSIPEGLQGIQGIQGEKGDKGDGLPSGGTAGQVVVKTVDGTAWTDLPPSTLADQEDVNITSPQNKQVLKYDGTEWVNATASGGVTVSDTNPVDPSQGDGWFYAEDGTQFIRYDDGSSVQWVQPNAVLSSEVEQRYYSPNYVINGGLDIWQRGTSTTTTAAAYRTADRWASWIDSGSGTVARDTTNVPSFLNYGIRYTSSGANGSCVFYHTIETLDAELMAGKNVNLSAYLSGTNGKQVQISLWYSTTVDNVFTGSWTLAGANTYSVTPSTTRVSATYFMPADAKTVQVRFYNIDKLANTEFTSFTGVQLEEGVTASPFRRNANSIQGELAACQRYFLNIGGAGTGYRPIGLGAVSASTTTSRANIFFPVEMRTTPAIDSYLNIIASDRVAFDHVISGITVDGISPSGTHLLVTHSNVSVTAHRPIYILSQNNGTGYIRFTAEL